MRMTQQKADAAQRIRRLGPGEWIVRFHPGSRQRRQCSGLPDELHARLLRYQRPGFRPSWLLTSLMNTRLCPHNELVDLYHRRWTLETIYREWKHSLDIQNLRSHTPAGIVKEVYAQLLLNNLVRWIMTEATEGTKTRPVDLSFLTTLSLIKRAVATLLQTRPTSVSVVYKDLLAEIRGARIRKRPGRSYPRPADGKIKHRGHGSYQLPARITRK